MSLAQQAEFSMAEDMFMRALGIREKAYGRQVCIAESCHQLGHVLKMQGKYEDAETHFLRGIGLHEQVCGCWHATPSWPKEMEAPAAGNWLIVETRSFPANTWITLLYMILS